MDKETPELMPTTLGDKGENAVKKIDSAAVQAASAQLKEQREEYYVDPLEQDALLQKKQTELSMKKENMDNNANESALGADSTEEVTIRPDMNVTGFFSSGETAKKGSILKRPVSGGVMKVFFAVSIVSVGFSVIYAITLIATLYRANWFMGWIYGILFFFSIVSIFFAIRSFNSMSDKIKKYAILDLIFTGISIIPLMMLLLNSIFKLA